ncbi:TRAP transporter small permease subunit [Fodinicurvata fenggangensis]|uniref:TRAP transporter small permease subunit n=1 Tax=Fodinicurvata fenggangensis TaxID=1121830 RepID=UPI000690F522|nr:TRAP transporter small permease subunit [Fodinicurvata fenggangensis]
MGFLIGLSRAIDSLNGFIGRCVYWLILIVVLISAGNAISRYLFSLSSNAWLEIQWYLFSAVFLLGAGYTLLRNEHVRIDVLYARLSPRRKAWIDIIGGLFFLLPVAIFIMVLSWPMFHNAFVRMEMSGNTGGLIRWPVLLLMPVGFFLLSLQGVSEVIKRIAFLAGRAPYPGGGQAHSDVIRDS